MVQIRRVPKGTIKPAAPFSSLEEKATYWDTHSVVDEIAEESAVRVHQAQKADSLTIRFAPEDIAKLREQASHKGIGPSTLVRMWIKERLQQP